MYQTRGSDLQVSMEDSSSEGTKHPGETDACHRKRNKQSPAQIRQQGIILADKRRTLGLRIPALSPAKRATGSMLKECMLVISVEASVTSCRAASSVWATLEPLILPEFLAILWT